MNFLEQCLTGAILLLSLQTNAQHSYPIEKIEVDSAWAKLVVYCKSDTGLIAKQARLLKYREDGLKFWKMFPNDSRRYQWLQIAVRHGKWLDYLAVKNGDSVVLNRLEAKELKYSTTYNWPLDKKTLYKWESDYPQLKAGFLSYYAKQPQTNSQDDRNSEYILDLFVDEMSSFLNLSLNKEYRQGNKIDLNRLLYLIETAGSCLNNMNFNNPIYAQKKIFGLLGYAFISRYSEYGLDAVDMNVFFSTIKKSKNSFLKNWAIQQSSLFALMREPLSLKYVSKQGDSIDLEKMRGKVVLVDFWALTCSSCIARMPAIKAIYDKYKNDGFEVISACLENNNNLSRVGDVERRIGSTWPVVLIGWGEGSLGQKIWKNYGFWGVPQLLLLNKEGRLVMLNDKLKNGDFEPEVKRLLAENYKSN